MKTLVNNKIDGEGDPTRSRYTYQEKVVWLKKTFKKKIRTCKTLYLVDGANGGRRMPKPQKILWVFRVKLVGAFPHSTTPLDEHEQVQNKKEGSTSQGFKGAIIMNWSQIDLEGDY